MNARFFFSGSAFSYAQLNNRGDERLTNLSVRSFVVHTIEAAANIARAFLVIVCIAVPSVLQETADAKNLPRSLAHFVFFFGACRLPNIDDTRWHALNLQEKWSKKSNNKKAQMHLIVANVQIAGKNRKSVWIGGVLAEPRHRLHELLPTNGRRVAHALQMAVDEAQLHAAPIALQPTICSRRRRRALINSHLNAKHIAAHDRAAEMLACVRRVLDGARNCRHRVVAAVFGHRAAEYVIMRRHPASHRRLDVRDHFLNEDDIRVDSAIVECCNLIFGCTHK